MANQPSPLFAIERHLRNAPEQVLVGDARGLTQQQLAAMIESNHPFISNMERGLTLPGLAMLARLALDCGVVDLIEMLDRGRSRRAKSRRE